MEHQACPVARAVGFEVEGLDCFLLSAALLSGYGNNKGIVPISCEDGRGGSLRAEHVGFVPGFKKAAAGLVSAIFCKLLLLLPLLPWLLLLLLLGAPATSAKLLVIFSMS